MFLAEPGAVTTLSGLTISGGNSQGNGGGIFVSYDSALTVSGCTIEDNTATVYGSGGGGGIENDGNLTVTDGSVIEANSTVQTAPGYGSGQGGASRTATAGR